MFNTPEHIRLSRTKSISYIADEAKDIKTFYFKYMDIAKVFNYGQFLMINVHGEEEIPLSCSYVDKKNGIIGVTVKTCGPTTKAMNDIKLDSRIGVRGPYGKSFNIYGSCIIDRIAVVGGGIGLATLMTMIETCEKDIDIYIGVKTKNQLCFLDRIKNTNRIFFISSDDGSIGNKGSIIDTFKISTDNVKYDQVITCGPELMMVKILDICNKHNIPFQASIERRMACARGLCGHCAIDGMRVCVEGPIFNGDVLNKLQDFGKYCMSECGECKNI